MSSQPFVRLRLDRDKTWFLQLNLSSGALSDLLASYSRLGRVRGRLIVGLWRARLLQRLLSREDPSRSPERLIPQGAVAALDSRTKLIAFFQADGRRFTAVKKIYSPEQAETYRKEAAAYLRLGGTLAPQCLSRDDLKLSIEIRYEESTTTDLEEVAKFCVRLWQEGGKSQHGDLAPWNFVRAQGELKAIDWENYEADGLPLYDLFYFIYNRAHFLKEPAPKLSDFLQLAPVQHYLSDIAIRREEHAEVLAACVAKFRAARPQMKLPR